MKTSNIYQHKKLSSSVKEEFTEKLIETTDVRIERILSTGQVTPNGKWFDQEKEEWVLLLEGNAEIEFEGEKIMQIKAGDYLNIPAHKKHRVTFTSATPACLWLAVHY
jgi:cupin 2 domain-containing protein